MQPINFIIYYTLSTTYDNDLYLVFYFFSDVSSSFGCFSKIVSNKLFFDGLILILIFV